MASRFAPMTAFINDDRKHRTITVVIEHDVFQSFSRAVVPRAHKEFKAWIYAHVMFGHLQQYVAADLGAGRLPTNKDRCLSTMTFTY